MNLEREFIMDSNPKIPNLYILVLGGGSVPNGMDISLHQDIQSAEELAVTLLKEWYELELKQYEGAYIDDLNFARLKEIEAEIRFFEFYNDCFAIDIFHCENNGRASHKV